MILKLKLHIVPLPAEVLQLNVTFCLEGGHSHQQLAQNGLLELLHLLGGQVRMQDDLVLETLHVGLELLLQGAHGPLGVLYPVGTEPSRALRGLQRQLDVSQELHCLFNCAGVASQKLSGLRNVHLQQISFCCLFSFLLLICW